jgi:hypothetical protein
LAMAGDAIFSIEDFTEFGIASGFRMAGLDQQQENEHRTDQEAGGTPWCKIEKSP